MWHKVRTGTNVLSDLDLSLRPTFLHAAATTSARCSITSCPVSEVCSTLSASGPSGFLYPGSFAVLVPNPLCSCRFGTQGSENVLGSIEGPELFQTSDMILQAPTRRRRRRKVQTAAPAAEEAGDFENNRRHRKHAALERVVNGFLSTGS